MSDKYTSKYNICWWFTHSKFYTNFISKFFKQAPIDTFTSNIDVNMLSVKYLF